MRGKQTEVVGRPFLGGVEKQHRREVLPEGRKDVKVSISERTDSTKAGRVKPCGEKREREKKIADGH